MLISRGLYWWCNKNSLCLLSCTRTIRERLDKNQREWIIEGRRNIINCNSLQNILPPSTHHLNKGWNTAQTRIGKRLMWLRTRMIYQRAITYAHICTCMEMQIYSHLHTHAHICLVLLNRQMMRESWKEKTCYVERDRQGKHVGWAIRITEESICARKIGIWRKKTIPSPSGRARDANAVPSCSCIYLHIHQHVFLSDSESPGHEPPPTIGR